MFKKIALGVMAAAMLGGCGEFVEVPPAKVGMLLTDNGYAPDIIPPSKLRINKMCIRPFCIPSELVLIANEDRSVIETMNLGFPKSDNLEVKFDVRLLVGVRDTMLKSMLDRVSPQRSERGQSIVTFDRIYDTYGMPIVRVVVRQVLAQYSVEEINANREAVNAEITKKLQEEMVATPVHVMRASISSFPLPDIIREMNEKSQKRKLELVKMETEKAISLKQFEIDLELAEKERAVELRKAEITVEIGKQAIEIMSPEYEKYRALETMELFARNPNANTIVVPTDITGVMINAGSAK